MVTQPCPNFVHELYQPTRLSIDQPQPWRYLTCIRSGLAYKPEQQHAMSSFISAKGRSKHDILKATLLTTLIYFKLVWIPPIIYLPSDNVEEMWSPKQKDGFVKHTGIESFLLGGEEGWRSKITRLYGTDHGIENLLRYFKGKSISIPASMLHVSTATTI